MNSRKRLGASLGLVAVVVLATGACGQPGVAPPQEASEAPPDTSQTEELLLVGQVLDLSLETNQVLIKHEDIGDFMVGMTMPFSVQDPSLLAPLKAGDLIDATLVVDEDDRSYISAITVTGSAPLPPEFTGVPAGVDVLEQGDEAPDISLTDQDGSEIRLSAWRGRVVAITFMYSRSPLPEFGPEMDRRFAEIQAGLAKEPTLGDRVHLLSVSLDPEHDTRDVLKAHAAGLGADTRRWHFATASADIVDRLAAEFGVSVVRETDGTVTHNLRTAVIGTDGRVAAIYPGNVWTATEALDDIWKALARGV